jgi:hypothetical protein
MYPIKKGQIWESLFNSSLRAFVIEKNGTLYVKYNYGNHIEKPVESAIDLDKWFKLAPDSPVK